MVFTCYITHVVKNLRQDWSWAYLKTKGWQTVIVSELVPFGKTSLQLGSEPWGKPQLPFTPISASPACQEERLLWAGSSTPHWPLKLQVSFHSQIYPLPWNFNCSPRHRHQLYLSGHGHFPETHKLTHTTIIKSRGTDTACTDWRNRWVDASAKIHSTT